MNTSNLRTLILQKAVSGKLVPQIASEGTAEELLKQIEAERAALIKAGKIKKEKPLPEITEDEIPFEIPKSWEWIRIGILGNYKKGPFGSSLTKSMFIPKSETAIKVYEQRNAIQKNATLGSYYISRDYFESRMKGFEVFPGDVIVSCAGTIGETYVLPENSEQGIINQALMRMKIVSNISLSYFLLYFDFILKDKSQHESCGTAIKNIPPFEIFKKMLFPLPPLSEQKRIVAKIEELMAEINNIECLQSAYTANQDALKQKIIEAGISGKLVPQIASEGTAEELLKQIEAERTELIKAGTIKKEKPLPEITEDEIPFEIPKNWMWVRLLSVCTKLVDGSHFPPPKVSHGVPVISAKNIQNGILTFENVERYATEEAYLIENKRTNISKGDILLAIVGSIGKVAIYSDSRKVIAQRSIAIIDTLIHNPYLKYLFESMEYQQLFELESGGIAQKGIYLNTLSKIVIPIPPLSEQKRIVTKIDELMQIIEDIDRTAQGV